MRGRETRGLIWLNAALLLVLGLVCLAPMSGAQGFGERPRGEYTVVGAKIQGGDSRAIIILDSVNQELVAIRWNDGRKALEPIGYRNLVADRSGQPGR